jgi:hypothetical protein
MGGYLVSGAIANACYPQVDGGSKLLFRIFSLDPGENVGDGICAGIRLSKTYAECQRRKLSDNQPTQPDDLLARGRKAIRSIRVKMKGLLVRFDREATGSPAIEASLEEFDP